MRGDLFCLFLLASCSGGNSAPPPSDPFAIHDGELRPACGSTLSRTDLVAPETVLSTHWGPPQKIGAALNTDCPEDDTEISSDGAMLFFYGAPHYGPAAAEILYGTTGMYYAPRIGGPGEFGAPRFLDLRQGTTGAGDGHARVTAAGDLVYFHSVRAQNTGYQLPTPVDDFLDIYVATLNGTVASPAQNLGSVVNSEYADGEPEISADGTVLYFASNRPGGLGGHDLYAATLVGGVWTVPTNLGAPINSADDESQAAFADGDPDTMYFTSNRDLIGSSIYRAQRSGGLWGAPELVVRGQVGSASLTADGSLLYFVHVETDNDPGDPVFGADLYYVQRL